MIESFSIERNVKYDFTMNKERKYRHQHDGLNLQQSLFLMKVIGSMAIVSTSLTCKETFQFLV